MENQWVKIARKLINKPESTRSRGARVQVMLSPFDVPTDLRTYNESGQYFVIEFKYLSSSEKVIDKKSNNGVVLSVGKASGRIYKIKIDCKYIFNNFDGELVLEMIVDAENDLSNSQDLKFSSGNKDAINNLFSSGELSKLELVL